MERILKNLVAEITFFGLTKFFIALFILFIPFQIRTLIIRDSIFITGNFNTYESFFIYAADILLILSLISWGLAYLFREIEWQIERGDIWLSFFMGLFILHLTVTFFFNPSVFGIFFILRLIMLYFFYLLLSNGILSRSKIIEYFIYGMVLQVIIATIQHLLQESAGLFLLGEPLIDLVTPGIAKVSLPTGMQLRSYGTFLHPNILGGALFMAILLTIYKFRKNIYLFSGLSSFFIMGSILTFSRSAVVALFLAVFCLIALSEKREMLKHIVFIGVIYVFFVVLFDLQGIFWQRFIMGDDGGAMVERMNYLEISREMIQDNPFGSGLGEFTKIMQFYTPLKLEPWEIQPVHNIFLLIAAEAGIAGVVIFGLIFFYIFFRIVYLLRILRKDINEKIFAMVMAAMAVGILTLGIFDHYFYTSYQGQIMLFLYFYLAGDLLKKFGWPRRKS